MVNIHSRKRSGLSILYMIFSLVMALMMLPGIYAETYNTSKPIIEVNYGEIPVTILDYNLSDIYGTNWTVFPITNPLYGLRGYNFTVSFLDNGDYFFYVLANDTDGNTVEGYKGFTIAHPEMGVWLISPITGIGKTPTYNITVGTQRIATCRWSTTNWPFNNKEKFDLELGEPFTITGNMTTHTLVYTASPYPIPLYVFCRNDIYGINLSDLANYGSTHFMVGYDTGPPEITELTADPNPVIDQNDKRTTIKAVTNEPTVCHITGGNESQIGNTNWGWEDNYFAGEDPSDYTSYKLEHEENISYNSVPIGQPYNARYNITCFDRAQWNDGAYQNVLVNINTSLIITQVTSGFVGDLTIDYEISTNVNANGCMMKLNGETDWQNMVGNTARNFTRPITLLLGENDIEVFCYASTTAFANFTVTADNEPPELQIDAFDSTCGLEEINVFINATDQGTGIDTVWYRITDSSQQVIVGWTEMEDPTDTTLTIGDLELENGEQYTVTAYAIDSANLYSDNETDTLTATGPEEPECDTIAPTVSITYAGDTYQKNVTVTCADDVGGAGCTESFDYADITEGSCADVESYDSMPYSELPLILTADTFLCVRVSDNAMPPNYGYANMSIPVTTVICGNNVAEPGVLGSEPEQCDGTDLRGFTCGDFYFNGGILACNPSDGTSDACKWNTSNCQLGNHGYCGDNETNDYYFEQCDGTFEDGDWGNIEGCTDFNFTGGSLSCNPYSMPEGQRCMFNTSGCYKAPNNPTPSCDGLGGSYVTKIDPNEQCEPFLFETLGIPALSCSDFDRFGQGELGCTDTCLIDISDCLAPPPDPFCGDGEIQPEGNETCDPPGSEISCDLLDDGAYTGGTVVCGENCRWSEFPCTPVSYCGDNERTGDEQCDGTDLGNMQCTDIGSYISGTLSCFPQGHPYKCEFDETNCDRGLGYCGDGLINNPFVEQCDGESWGRISKQANVGCQQFGFTGGTLTCNAPSTSNQCMFDTHLCTDISPNDDCGDRILQSGEQCELNKPFTLSCMDFDSYTGGDLECDYDTCLFDTTGCNDDPLCGNGQVDDGETCDGNDFGELNDCSDLRPTLIGPLECYPPGHENECHIDENACEYLGGGDEYCGDGIANGLEDCDGDDFGLMTCSDIGSLQGGILACNANCSFNTDNCDAGPGYCGDNIINNFANEQCDGDSWGNVDDCTDFGFTGGTLSCNSPESPNKCIFNTTMCTGNAGFGVCGNQVLNRAEQCELNRPLTLGCTDFDAFVGGDIGCDYSLCRYDISGCEPSQGGGYCGDDMINDFPNEDCDGDDWGNIDSCDDIDPAFIGGSLSCSDDCSFDTGNCISENGGGECGDGEVNPDEECEAEAPFGALCTDFDKFIGGDMGCYYSICQYDLSGCQTAVNLYCGDGVITDGLGEECDGEVIGPVTECSEFDDRFVSGQLGCTNDCQYDLSSCVEGGGGDEYCGDGIMNNYPNEQCDIGTNGVQCKDFNGFTGGILTCGDNCQFNTSQCESPYDDGNCGDGQLNSYEQCEPGQAINITCQDIGFLGGDLFCNAEGRANECMLNVSNCVPAIDLGYCGDGYVIPDEEWCDTNNLGGLDCTYFDKFVQGILGCYPADHPDACYWDTSNCGTGKGYCGDGIINNPFDEQCDGDDWGRIDSCVDFGFNSGTLRCYAPEETKKCTFDTSACNTPAGDGPCGDSILHKGEQCEVNMEFDLGCTDFDGYIGGTIDCDYSTCQYVLDGCTLPSVAVCGDGFISGSEQCDGLNLGPTTLCIDFADEFIGGPLACYPPDSERACRFDMSNCESEVPVTDCGNNNVEDGEECDGTENFFSCEDFELTSGSIGCYDDCTLDLSSCIGGTVIEQICGNDRSEPSEECDGNVEQLFAQSFIDLYGCQYGLGCSDVCTIECLAEVTYTCDNLIKDGDETGFNCGGSCPSCDAGESCIDNVDCKSGKCVDGECALDQCMNGILDGDETGMDCGGSCSACPEGEYCFSDNDCQSGRCIDGICMTPEILGEEEKPNTAGIILIIIGLVMMLGGGGYVIYEEYFDNKRIAAKHPTVMPTQQQRPQQPQMTIDPKILEMQRKKQEERRQQQQDARKSLLEGFDKESTLKHEDDIEQLKERKVNKDVLKEAGYIDLTEQKPEEKESGDIFDKLKKIGDKQKSEEKKAESGFETYDDEEKNKTLKADDTISPSTKGRNSRLVKVKRKSDTFEKLGTIGKGVNESDIRSTSGKISELSGKKKSVITKILNSESISQKQANNIFSNLDKERLTSDVFREILSDLVSKGKLSKETVSAMLFEYMDNGTIEKSDVAKIMSELKMI